MKQPQFHALFWLILSGINIELGFIAFGIGCAVTSFIWVAIDIFVDKFDKK